MLRTCEPLTLSWIEAIHTSRLEVAHGSRLASPDRPHAIDRTIEGDDLANARRLRFRGNVRVGETDPVFFVDL